MNVRRILGSIAILVSIGRLDANLARADGLADNIPSSVRRVPKLGIAIKPEDRDDLQKSLAEFDAKLATLNDVQEPLIRTLLPDALICRKAVADALKYGEIFEESEIEKARRVLKLGNERLAALTQKSAAWPTETGLAVRGYRSKIDGSVQPYGLVVPPHYSPTTGRKYRLDVWFHGRGETLSELNFIEDRRKNQGEFAPLDTIVLHPYGRYCNAFKFAGEVDVLEAIEAVRRNYSIDPDRIAVRGFSMGGAAAWQFAVHFPDRWFAANPGAGFSETPKFLKVFQKEELKPTWYEEALWQLYDCDRYALNLAQCPTVAYSGELDIQKQAADAMADALTQEGISLVHVIGPKTKHSYEPAAKREVERRMESLAEHGRTRFPLEVHFETYTLKYNRCAWLTIDAIGEHWKKARVDARIDVLSQTIDIKAENIAALSIDFPPGYAPFSPLSSAKVMLNQQTIKVAPPTSDRSWQVRLHKGAQGWIEGPILDALVKRHDLQGPIDDAFMDSFLFVKPTGTSANSKLQRWVEQEMAHASEHWRRQFRGEARIKDDKEINDADFADSNLILWGDPQSNSLLKSIADRLPIGWDERRIKAGTTEYDSSHHALIMIYPNPANPKRYVVVNSGFTFREYDYLNNARQVPKLPDWAIVDLDTPPTTQWPGKIVDAAFFDERWQLKPSHP